MADLRAFICNCIIRGDKFSLKENGGRIRNHLELRLSGYLVDLYQAEKVILGNRSDLINRWNHTTELVISNVIPEHVNKVKNIITDLTNLLSFINVSRIWPYGWEYPDRSGLKSFTSTIGTTQYFRPVIDIDDGSKVSDFIHQIWRPYQKNKRKRKLPELIDYLIQADLPQQPVELRLAILFVVLENLKDTWARVQRIPYAHGYFRKISNPPKPNIRKEPTYSFEELLAQMLKSVGMRRGLKRIIKLRNQIIHSGLSRRPFRSNQKTYENCQDIVREYVLRLLKFSGSFYPYTSPNVVKII
ncbi:conserved hypothetical protein [delta proteobacterium NaphS2]|nr:conserved hypothetical protein [delta proteobacterium NaphS2]